MATEVVEIRLTSDDRTSVPMELQCLTGPVGWTDKKVCAIALPPQGSGTFEYLDANDEVLFEDGHGWGSAQAVSDELLWRNEDGRWIAYGSFAGTDWQVAVLYYLDGYRLTVDGRVLFEGVLREGEPFVFPIFEGEAAASDALVLFVDGGEFARSVSIDAGPRWEGRWTPGSTAKGAKARMWVIEAPGSGVGSLLVDGIARGQVRWP